MLYMALSLVFTAGGIIVLYLLGETKKPLINKCNKFIRYLDQSCSSIRHETHFV